LSWIDGRGRKFRADNHNVLVVHHDRGGVFYTSVPDAALIFYYGNYIGG
jgi:hypothetical protein